uniref:hypothetical protein n=1 Tax=Synechococcus sp. UW106 TaxID=368495 RepID=UPI000E0FE784|nr:hypothetical protein [Synechococcus sp. UW106]
MPEATTSDVELTCLQGLADLERLEGSWLEEMQAGDPETVAITLRLLMAHMASMSKRLMGAMVLDRLDVELAITRLDADVCHAAVDNSPFCQHGNDSSSATA